MSTIIVISIIAVIPWILAAVVWLYINCGPDEIEKMLEPRASLTKDVIKAKFIYEIRRKI